MQHNFSTIDYFFKKAILAANTAYGLDEVPIGCVIVDPFDKILSISHNLKEQTKNPTHHAEILGLNTATKILDSWRLIDCSVFVTLEPCYMCFGALLQARVKNLYFGAYDPKAGALSSKIFKANNPQLNHQLNIYGGLYQYECAQLLTSFFVQKRKFFQL